MKGERDRQMREEMVVKPLEGGIEDFVEPICSLLEAAENFVDMSTSLYPDFYNKDELKDAIKTCVKKVIKFRILLDKDADIDALKKEIPWIFDLQDKYLDTLEIAQASGDISHWILVDEISLRLEEKHKYEEKLILRNLYIQNPPLIIAKTYIRQFDIWWDTAERV